jgi:hypothetical protein
MQSTGDHTTMMGLHDVSDALSQPGCPVCRLKTESTDRYLDSLLWEGVNDPARRAGIRQAHGFCQLHAWRLARPGSALGVAVITQDVLRSIAASLENNPYQPLPWWSLRRMQETLARQQPAAATAGLVAHLIPQAQCPACIWAEKMERTYLDVLLENLVGQDGLLARYETSDGLCLPHFRLALTLTRDKDAFETLVSAQQAIWQRLIDDLGEFIRKSDHRFRDESWGREADAWLRALTALVGAPPFRKEP